MLQSLLSEVLSHWPKVSVQKFKEHPFIKRFTKEFCQKLSTVLAHRNRHLSVTASIGTNRWERVPGFFLLDNDVAPTTKSGFYVCYLFTADGSGVYLSLNQASDKQAHFRKQTLLRHIPELNELFNGPLKLHSECATAKALQNNNIAAKFYCALALPDEQSLLEDLMGFLGYYLQGIHLFKLRVRHRHDMQDRTLMTLPSCHLVFTGADSSDRLRFIEEQAELTGNNNFLSVEVNKGWREPLALFVEADKVTGKLLPSEALTFIVSAWQRVVAQVNINADGSSYWCYETVESIEPFWLCLDEIDDETSIQCLEALLKILNKSCWLWDSDYRFDKMPFRSEALVSADVLCNLDEGMIVRWRKTLGLEYNSDRLWQHFEENGIGMPFNLMLAANVDSGHSSICSTKLIDRALVIDFNYFYSLKATQRLKPAQVSNAFEYPIYSNVAQARPDLLLADPDCVETLEFFMALNKVLANTSPVLCNRVRDELLMMVLCFDPKDKLALQALWDDFLMIKVLPKLESCYSQLKVVADKACHEARLDNLSDCLSKQLYLIWDNLRIDWFQEDSDVTKPVMIKCRSRARLAAIKKRLILNGAS